MKQLLIAALFATMLLTGCGPSTDELRTQGIAEFQVGHLDKAQSLFDRVLERKPSDGQSLYYMGRIYHATGFFERAIYCYESAIDADPSLDVARLWLMRAKSEAGSSGKILEIIPPQNPRPSTP
jgi:tetratricopeptide (TPR) repeat protein